METSEASNVRTNLGSAQTYALGTHGTIPSPCVPSKRPSGRAGRLPFILAGALVIALTYRTSRHHRRPGDRLARGGHLRPGRLGAALLRAPAGGLHVATPGACEEFATMIDRHWDWIATKGTCDARSSPACCRRSDRAAILNMRSKSPTRPDEEPKLVADESGLMRRVLPPRASGPSHVRAA